ncbi:MAG: FKBP-type peptidyl-prolyl cis-trans isomerase [Candidatus Aminicenantes bacterium]|nr:FKBP-type peptidyl-prolyl cis-trans isomerase [Candidatus Aminicenantes bacterium]
MKRLKLVVMFVGIVLLVGLGCQTGNAGETGKKVSLDTEKAKVSYSIGFNIGQNLRSIKNELDLAVLVQGLYDGVAGDDKAQLTQEDMQKILTEFQKKQKDLQEQKRKESGEKNKVDGEAFIKENAKKPGVVTTASGLQYKVITQGTGPTPKATDTVKVHYRGTLLDGTEFDSSYKRGQPATFPLNRVIPAWTEGVQLMKVGSKYTIYAPADIAYGERGAGQNIGPNATLIFEVELLGIEPPLPPPPGPKELVKPLTPKPVEPKK